MFPPMKSIISTTGFLLRRFQKIHTSALRWEGMESIQDFGRQKKRRKKRKKRKGETVGDGPMHFGDTVDDELKAQVLRSKTRTPSIAKPPEPNYIMPVTLNVDSMQRLYYETSLIEKVQMVRVFKDSKKFVDMKLKYPVHEVMENFNKFQTENLNKGLGRDEMTTFVEKNFEDFEELVPWTPPDFVDKLPLVDKIVAPEYKEFVKSLNHVWLRLTRKVNDDVRQFQEMTSAIYLPYGMVIPGGRFREVYYWDTYWIIKGLLICHMFDTAKGMLLNFFNLVQNLGHIPNGTRKYYIGRSQPPLMTMMVEEYLTRTGDFAFVKENIHHLDAEMTFWYNSRRVRVYAKDKAFIVYRYYSAIPLPRPESYREDKITASGEHTEVGVNMRYISIRSAAESGWDFSTRWLIFQGENLGTLNDCATMFIIPVDLNAFMHYNYKLLTDWHARIGNTKYVQLYNERAQYQQFLLDELFWNPTSGIWLDYDAFHERPRDYFYLSNFVPLWTKSYTKDADTMLIKLSQYIDQYHFENFQGGFPTSVYTTTEQWDYPNSWPPLQVFLIQGLGKMDTPVASKMAKDYATLWVHSNYQGFIQFDSMFEKYDCMRPGEIGGSGEYKAQEGFGWTNAIVLELLEQYPDIPCIKPQLMSFYETMYGKKRATVTELVQEEITKTRQAKINARRRELLRTKLSKLEEEDEDEDDEEHKEK